MDEMHSNGRIVHVSTAHHWNDSRIFSRMCRSLAADGYEVVLLARAEAEQEADGVRVVPVPAAHSRLGRMAGSIPRVAAKAYSLRGAVYHLHDPELIPLIPLLRLSGAKVIYDAHEDLGAQILEKEYLPSAVRPAVAVLGRLLVTFADRTANHSVAASPKVAEGFRAARCTVVRNFPEELPQIADPQAYEQRAHRVVYAGGLTRSRGVEQMVDAMRQADLPDSWRLRLVGRHSPDDLIDRLRERAGWDRVEYRGEVSPLEARRLMSECRIGLALLQPIGQYVDVLPTKLFEYMSLGIPVVASDYPQCREVVEGSGCGLVVDPTDPRAIGAAVAELAADPERAKAMGERGRTAVAGRYHWAGEAKALLEVYRQLLASDRIGQSA
jgi:glycosyltransferase involved in cell wall biosynthesis